MPARLIGLFTAVAIFLGLKSSKPTIDNMESHVLNTIDKSYQSWVEKGWIEDKVSTKV